MLRDRDEWAVEVEWPDGTLERINTHKDYSSAANWVATQSEAWLHFIAGGTPIAVPSPLWKLLCGQLR